MTGHHILFSLDGVPVLQNRVYPTAEQAMSCATGDVRLQRDPNTHIVGNAAFSPERVSYDETYQNEQGCSPRFQQHLEQVASIVARLFTGRKIVEIGCGKGRFLELMRSSGLDAIGVDPAYEGNAPYVVRQVFSPGLGLSVDAFVLRHVLEHVAEPLLFLETMARASGGRGTVFIEVPCFDWILRNRAWFDIYYEHVNYFRGADFDGIFGTTYESGTLFGGQYLYVVADLATLRSTSGRDRVDDGLGVPPDFLGGVGAAAARIASDPHRRHVVWGAASKGVLFALHLMRRGARLDFAIDINPAKQGRFLPVSGLRVHGPEDALRLLQPGDTIFVMNPNYLGEIQQMTEQRYEYCLA